MFKELFTELNEAAIPVPRGYRHFDKRRQLQELEKVLLAVGFSQNEVKNIEQNKNAIKKKLQRIQPQRDVEQYINYVFNFGLNQNKSRYNTRTRWI